MESPPPKLDAEFEELEDDIISWKQQDESLSELGVRIHRFKRKVIELQLDDIDVDPVADRLLKAVHLLEEYHKSLQMDEQAKNIRLLTIISTVCLPLSCIIAACSRNSYFMGMDPTVGTKGRRQFYALVLTVCLAMLFLLRRSRP